VCSGRRGSASQPALVPRERLLQRFLHLPCLLPPGLEWIPLALGGGKVLHTWGGAALGGTPVQSWPLAPRGCFVLPSCGRGAAGASPPAALPLQINHGANITPWLGLCLCLGPRNAERGKVQRSAGLRVGSFLAWQIAEFFSASQRGGEGTVSPLRFVVSSAVQK